MPGDPFRKAAPRPNLRASVCTPKVGPPQSTVPVPKQPMSPPKSAPAAKMGKMRVTTDAKRSMSPRKPAKVKMPGPTPGRSVS